MLKGMAKHPDLSMRYLVFFYELCKMGVVVFDLNKLEQKKILAQMLDMLRDSLDKELNQEQMQRRQLYALIVYQLSKYAVPERHCGNVKAGKDF